MATQARKISFEEAWDSATIFFVDEELEDEIDAEVESLLTVASDSRVSEDALMEIDSITEFLTEHELGLDVILRDVELSEEKFMRMVSLLRKIGRISGGFSADDTEWTISRIKNKLVRDRNFAHMIAELLLDGKNDHELKIYIPRYYLETLNYREIRGSSLAARRIRYKRSLIGTYGGRKGYKVENLIRQELARIQTHHGIPYEKGRSRIIDTDIDFAVPNVEDPWIIIMSSFQETTSSGQTNKTRDMLSAYIKVLENNSRNRENRAFVNFVDGGGWLARKRDLQRLVEQCHYFINMQHLDMLEAIVLKHVPAKYIHSK
ncbi:MAG: hypothetical protein KJ606_07850 [Chloroflexi bacterium]|nr:hypothetical protein [Chloroflexota bacterium]